MYPSPTIHSWADGNTDCTSWKAETAWCGPFDLTSRPKNIKMGVTPFAGASGNGVVLIPACTIETCLKPSRTRSFLVEADMVIVGTFLYPLSHTGSKTE